MWTSPRNLLCLEKRLVLFCVFLSYWGEARSGSLNVYALVQRTCWSCWMARHFYRWRCAEYVPFCTEFEHQCYIILRLFKWGWQWCLFSSGFRALVLPSHKMAVSVSQMVYLRAVWDTESPGSQADTLPFPSSCWGARRSRMGNHVGKRELSAQKGSKVRPELRCWSELRLCSWLLNTRPLDLT